MSPYGEEQLGMRLLPKIEAAFFSCHRAASLQNGMVVANGERNVLHPVFKLLLKQVRMTLTDRSSLSQIINSKESVQPH